jgi:hypothetical protein
MMTKSRNLDQADIRDQRELKRSHQYCYLNGKKTRYDLSDDGVAPFIPGPQGGMSQMFLCSGCGIEFTLQTPFPVNVSSYDLKRAREVYGWVPPKRGKV